MARHRNADVAPPTAQGVHDGLAYALHHPEGTVRGGVLVLHGSGSRKESHFDFARLCQAAGLAALTFDLRGHGESEGAMGPRVLDDVATIAKLLDEGPLFLRGSSMGGLLALAAAERVGARAVVAICPAAPALMARGLESGPPAFRAEAAALAELFSVLDPEAAAAALGADLLLLHAEGDERVAVEHSVALHTAAPGSRFERIPGGHHRSIQHDPELQALSVKFLLERAP